MWARFHVASIARWAVALALAGVRISAASPEHLIEEEIRREALRQTTVKEHKEVIDSTLLPTPRMVGQTPVLALDAPDPGLILRTRREEQSQTVSDSSASDQNWLVEGLRKLQGREPNATPAPDGPGFPRANLSLIDRWAEFRLTRHEQATFAQRSLVDENDPLSYSSLLPNKFLQDNLTNHPAYGSWHDTDMELDSSLSHPQRTGVIARPVASRPQLSGQALTQPPNPFLTPELPPIALRPTPPPSPALSVSPQVQPWGQSSEARPESAPPPAPETRRYQPEKGIDEKYFRNLRRF